MDAIETIKRFCRDGDVITVRGTEAWYNLVGKLIHWAERTIQNGIFKAPDLIAGAYNPNNDSHTLMYFMNESIRKYIGGHEKIQRILEKEPDAALFSVETPVATLVPISHYAMRELTVMRYCRKQLDEQDASIMLNAALPLIGVRYDIGQLLDIAVGTIAGYPTVQKYTIFDFGKRNKVCSAGVAAIYAGWRHFLEKQGNNFPRLFSSLNPAKWDPDFIERFKKQRNKWSVERTYPANFSNTGHFKPADYEVVLKMVSGEVVYRKE